MTERGTPGAPPTPANVQASYGVRAAEQPPPAPAAAPRPAPQPARRRARLSVVHVDPWSVTKVAFLFSLVAAVVVLVAVALLWYLLDGLGVFTSLSSALSGVTKDEQGNGFQLLDYVGLGRVLGVASILALVDVVLITALATLGAFLYNLSSSITGGLEVTLAE